MEGVAVTCMFAGRNVLITGHTGFKGSWLVLLLHFFGARVHGFAHAPEHPSLFSEAGIDRLLCTHTIGDVRDFYAISDTISRVSPELIFHLAAQPLVRKSYIDPSCTWGVNVMGSVNVLDAVRHNPGVRVCQVITSDKCYENHGQVYAFRETDPIGGHDPYSSSKSAVELAVASWRRSFFGSDISGSPTASLSSVRAGNVIGGGDWAEDRIIPDCIRALSADKPILVRNPTSIRPWQHVLEPLSGYLTLAAHQLREPVRFADAFNFGPLPNANLNVGHVADLVIAEWGQGSWHYPGLLNTSATDKPWHEAVFLKLDITKSSSLLGWTPILSSHDAIRHTVQWYRKRYLDGTQFDALGECMRELEAYVKQQPSLQEFIP